MQLDSFPIHITEDDAVDLHLHTVAYDGFWTPDTLVDFAHQQGLKVIAVADHDTLANVARTRQLAVDRDVVVVPAVEVTVSFDGAMHHLLLYNVDMDDPALVAMLDDIRLRHRTSAEQGLAKLRQRGLDFPHLEAIRAGRELMPLYVYAALLKAGHARDIDEAIAMGDEVGISFRIAAEMEKAIEVAHRQGALAVLAHPGRGEFGFMPATIETLEGMLAIGLDGLEVYHGQHTAQDIAFYGRFAEEHELLVSCGSDSHGRRDRTPPIPWPAHLCQHLLERCGLVVGGHGRAPLSRH